MTTHTQTGPRPKRLRATLIGVGLDGNDGPQRIITGRECLIVGGSAQMHAEMLQTVIRLESELDRLGLGLAEVGPDALAEIARRIESPELEEIAERLAIGLERTGRSFHETSADELTNLAAG